MSEAAGHLTGLTSLLEEFRSISSFKHNSGLLSNAYSGGQITDEDKISLSSDNAAVQDFQQNARHREAFIGNTHTADLPQGALNLSELPSTLSLEALSRPRQEDNLTHFDSLNLVPGEVVLPAEHIHCAGQSLPSLATELVAAQSSQVDEVQRRKDRLKQLRAKLTKEKDRLSSIERDICSTARAICLFQDESAGYSQDCTTLEKEVSRLIKEKHEMESKLEKMIDEAKTSSKMFKTYRDKIEKHAAKALVVESTHPLYKEVKGLENTIQALKEQRCEYMQGDGLSVLSGEKQSSLQDQTDKVLAMLADVEEEKNEINKMIVECKDHNQQIRRELDMKRKRHTAQLTRLQRQVSEAQSRRRQWAKEAEQLQTTITELRQKLK